MDFVRLKPALAGVQAAAGACDPASRM